MELARLYSEFGNKEAATNALADAVRLNPNDARQWAALGKVREESGDNTQALANYQHSLEINPAGRRGGPRRRLAVLHGPTAAGASAAAGQHTFRRAATHHRQPAHARGALGECPSGKSRASAVSSRESVSGSFPARMPFSSHLPDLP